jgi:hypothetical protein
MAKFDYMYARHCVPDHGLRSPGQHTPVRVFTAMKHDWITRAMSRLCFAGTRSDRVITPSVMAPELLKVMIASAARMVLTKQV